MFTLGKAFLSQKVGEIRYDFLTFARKMKNELMRFKYQDKINFECVCVPP